MTFVFCSVCVPRSVVLSPVATAVMGASFLHPHQHGLFFTGLGVLVPGFLSALVPLTVTWLLQCAIIYVNVVGLLRFSCPLLFTSGLALVSLFPIIVA